MLALQIAIGFGIAVIFPFACLLWCEHVSSGSETCALFSSRDNRNRPYG